MARQRLGDSVFTGGQVTTHQTVERSDIVEACVERSRAGLHTTIRGRALVGKSLLARHLADRIADSVLIVGRREMAHIGFGVLTAELGNLDPLARLATLVERLSRHSLIVIDDPDRLDSDTLSAIATAGATTPIIAVCRIGEALPSPLVRAGLNGSASIELTPLPLGEIRTLLRACTVPISPMALWLAGSFAAGRPGLAAYLTRRAEAEGSWSFLTPDLEPDQTLVDLANECFDTEHLQVLAVLGLVGRLPFQPLVAAVGLLGVEHARCELLVSDDGMVEAATPLMARCARRVVPPFVLQDAARRIDPLQVTALARVGVADACRDTVDALSLLDAADDAAAHHHVRTAIDLIGRITPSDDVDQTRRIVDVLEALGDYRRIPALVEPFRGSGLPTRQRASWARLCATAAFFDDSLNADERVTAACSQLDRWLGDPGDRGPLVAERAALLWSAGRFSEAVELIDDPELAVSIGFRVRTFGIRASRLMAIGDIDRARREAVELIPSAIAMGPGPASVVVGTLVIALTFELQFDEAERLLELVEASLAPGVLGQRAHLLGCRAAMMITRGKPVEAMEAIDEAIDIVQFCGDRSLLPILGALGAQAALNSVEHYATRRVEEYAELLDLGDSDRLRVFDPLNEGIRAAVQAARGDHKRAVGKLLAAAQTARAHGFHGEEIRQLHAAVCVGATTSLRSQRMTTLKREVSSPELRMMIDRIVATERADPFGLMEVSKRLSEAGAVLEAAECAAQAAAAARQVGRIEYSTECDLTSMALLARAPGAETFLIRLLRNSDNRFQLTSRERTIVTMAQQGMTNKQIAAQMFIGVRTVEGHLLRSYAKLGVTSRAELRTVN